MFSKFTLENLNRIYLNFFKNYFCCLENVRFNFTGNLFK